MQDLEGIQGMIEISKKVKGAPSVGFLFFFLLKAFN